LILFLFQDAVEPLLDPDNYDKYHIPYISWFTRFRNEAFREKEDNFFIII